jgi:transcriptional regulator with XRE-family HTH domain
MMAKKRKPEKNRLDPMSAGVDLDAILSEIRPYMEGQQIKDIAAKMGVTPEALSPILNGHRKPNLAFLANLAAAIGGSLDVKFHPPK